VFNSKPVKDLIPTVMREWTARILVVAITLMILSAVAQYLVA
jgi:hypothetical protein